MLRFVRLVSCDSNKRFWHLVLSDGLPTSEHALQLGVTALQLLCLSPGDGHVLETSLLSSLSKTATPFVRQRDVLPLPLPPIGAALQLLGQCKRSSTGMLLVWALSSSARGHKQKQAKLISAGCMQLWRLLVVLVLNGEFAGWVPPMILRHGVAGTASQKEALKHLTNLCEYFTCTPWSNVLGTPSRKPCKVKASITKERRCCTRFTREAGGDHARSSGRWGPLRLQMGELALG